MLIFLCGVFDNCGRQVNCCGSLVLVWKVDWGEICSANLLNYFRVSQVQLPLQVTLTGDTPDFGEHLGSLGAVPVVELLREHFRSVQYWFNFPMQSEQASASVHFGAGSPQTAVCSGINIVYLIPAGRATKLPAKAIEECPIPITATDSKTSRLVFIH